MPKTREHLLQQPCKMSGMLQGALSASWRQKDPFVTSVEYRSFSPVSSSTRKLSKFYVTRHLTFHLFGYRFIAVIYVFPADMRYRHPLSSFWRSVESSGAIFLSYYTLHQHPFFRSDLSLIIWVGRYPRPTCPLWISSLMPIL